MYRYDAFPFRPYDELNFRLILVLALASFQYLAKRFQEGKLRKFEPRSQTPSATVKLLNRAPMIICSCLSMFELVGMFICVRRFACIFA